MDLPRASVFLDFDGTITAVDTGVHLLEALAHPSWREIESEYVGGTIGSRECLVRQWAMLPRDEARLRAVAGQVALDPGVGPLVDCLPAAGAQVTVVSDGYGFYAEDVCARLGIDLLTNTVDWSTGELTFPHVDRCCPCSTCGP